MNSLLPIALPAGLPVVNPIMPAGIPAVVTDGASGQVNTFLSLLRQSSTTLMDAQAANPADVALETTPPDSALRNSTGLNALGMNVEIAPITPVLHAAVPAGLPNVATEGDGAQVNTLLALLRRSSASLVNGPTANPATAPSETTPTDRALRNKKGLAALPTNAARASIAPAVHSTVPAVLPNVAEGPGAQVNTLLSAQGQSATAPVNDPGANPAGEAPLEATPTDRALKNNGGLNALPMNTANASIALAGNQPLPPGSSLNISATPRDSKISRPQKATSNASDAAPQAEAPPAPSLPLAPPTTVPAPMNSTPASAGTSVDQVLPTVAPPNAPASSIQAPVEQQISPRPTIDARAIEPAVPSKLAFALRLEPTGHVEATATAAGSRLPDLSSRSTSGQQPAVAAVETPQNPAADQSSLQAYKHNQTEPAAMHAQQTQSQTEQNANADSTPGSKGEDSKGQDNKSGDTNRESHRGALGLSVEPPVSPNSGPNEISPVATQGVTTPSAPPSLPASSEPAPSQAMQTASHVSLTDETAKTGPANQISFSVAAGDQQKVEVRVIDRAGEVRVSVRAPNEELAGTLRQDLGSLTGKLNQSGFSTEAFTPSRGGAESSREQKTPDQQQPGGGERQSSGRNQQHGSQQNGGGKRPAWLDELENSQAT